MLKSLFAHFRADLAVDLGTAHTVICLPHDGPVVDEPSVVAVERATQRVLSGGCAVGHLARQMQGRTPESIRVVQPLSDGVVADFELCQAMLRYFFLKAQATGWRMRPRVFVAASGCITPVEKRALWNSLERAGARQVLVLDEARAAAIGAGLPIHEPVASMVCDIGAGTTDVAVLSLGDVVASRSIRVGGRRMDEAVVDYLRRHHSLRVGRPAAEQLRIDIGSAYPLGQERSEEIRGVDTVSGLPRRSMVTSEEVRHALAEPLDKILETIKDTIDGCPAELAADLVDHGLVLSGGGALLRGLERFITEQTGLPAHVCEQPLLNVARGMQFVMEDLRQWEPMVETHDHAA